MLLDAAILIGAVVYVVSVSLIWARPEAEHETYQRALRIAKRRCTERAPDVAVGWYD